MLAPAIKLFDQTRVSAPEGGTAAPEIMGMATVVRAAYEGRDLSGLLSKLSLKVAANPFDAAALFDLSILLQAIGQRDRGLEFQRLALTASRRFTRTHGDGSGLDVLVITTHGDLMATTPIDFLLETSNARQHLIFVDTNVADFSDLPEHDVAFFAVGEAPETTELLARLESALSSWPGPILNNAPSRISCLTRDGVAALFEGAEHVLAPRTVRVSRRDVYDIASGCLPLAHRLPGETFPLIIRPLGTHAGTGLEKIETPDALREYLDREPAETLYLAPFIDYASPDGFFRKQRIAFIDGVPYASHLAVSEHWIVHYLSAGMTEHAGRRDEEARWMVDFEAVTCSRMSRAFAEVQARIGLNYFAIDCAELADGRLLLFEADVAMIVHALDSDDLFPYKKPAMDRLFAAFMRALESRSRTSATRA